MKKILCILITVTVFAAALFCGCAQNGASTVDVTVNNNFAAMTDEQWRDYMNGLSETGDNAAKRQAAISHSLMSGVSILTRFEYQTAGYVKQTSIGAWGGSGLKKIGTQAYHLIFCGAGVIVELDKTTGDAYVVTNCHVVYDDSSATKISDEVYLYLYGGDTDGENYEVGAKYCSYGGKTVYNANGDALVDYDLMGITEGEGNAEYSVYKQFCIPAQVVGASVKYDIALLKITASDALKNGSAAVASFAESDDVYAGQPVYAVGNPEGDGMSVTSGVISKESEIIELGLSEVDKEDVDFYRVIRTDAAINGGNSGGGMYNDNGELVGIINSKSVSEEIDNMGFALPGSNVKRLWPIMKEVYESGNSYFSLSDPYVKRAVFPAEYRVVASSSRLDNGYAIINQTIAVTKSVNGFESGDVLKKIKITDSSGKVIEDKNITRTYNIEDTLLSAREGYTVSFTVDRQNVLTQVEYTASLQRV